MALRYVKFFRLNIRTTLNALLLETRLLFTHILYYAATDQFSEYRAKGKARLKIPRQNQLNIMAILTFFFLNRDMVYYELLKPGYNVKKDTILAL